MSPMAAAREPLVLVIDDEEVLAGMIAQYLERAGFATRLAADGPTGLRLARETDPDVIVLDLGLPGLDGVELCRQVRTFSDCYIVMATARADEVDTLVGLSVGADDYVTKPFSVRELVARIQAMMRRPRGPRDADPPLIFGALTLDLGSREVHLEGAPVDLTRTEFDLLAALASRPRLALSRRQLIDDVWGPDWVGDDHVVDVHLAHVRRKLGDDAGQPRFVQTVRGVGYRMGTGR